MSVVPNLIYMFEFVVDDLVITRNNYCAPDEYPIYVDIIFRSSVYVSICDRGYGEDAHLTRYQNGKRCIFVLNSPVTNDDRLLVYVYKKRSSVCKFLIGLMEIKIQFLFDRVIKGFNTGNIDWDKEWQGQLSTMPKMKDPTSNIMDKCECFDGFDSGYERHEQLRPHSEISKQMIPIFNLCKQQTGNLVLIMRLSCHGPSIVSAFRKLGNHYVPQPPEEQPHNDPSYLQRNGSAASHLRRCYRFFACNKDKLCPCDCCEDDCNRINVASKRCSKKAKAKKSFKFNQTIKY